MTAPSRSAATSASRRRSSRTQTSRPVRVSGGPGLFPSWCLRVLARGWVAVYCAPAGRLRRGWARRPVTGFRSAWGPRAGHSGVSVLGAFRSYRAGLRRWSASTACPSGNPFPVSGAVRAWPAGPWVRAWVGEAGSPSILKACRPEDSHIAQGHPEPVHPYRSRALDGLRRVCSCAEVRGSPAGR